MSDNISRKLTLVVQAGTTEVPVMEDTTWIPTNEHGKPLDMSYAEWVARHAGMFWLERARDNGEVAVYPDSTNVQLGDGHDDLVSWEYWGTESHQCVLPKGRIGPEDYTVEWPLILVDRTGAMMPPKQAARLDMRLVAYIG